MAIELNSQKSLRYIAALDTRAKTAYPNNVYGFLGWGMAHLADGSSQALQDDILLMIAEHDTLTVETTLNTVPADGISEVVITCPALLTNIDYVIYLDNVMVSSGSVSDGSIELSVNEIGIYIVEVKNPTTYETGYIEIEGV